MVGKFEMAEFGQATSHPEQFRKSLALWKTQITTEPCGGGQPNLTKHLQW